jgi:hypothetical protein
MRFIAWKAGCSLARCATPSLRAVAGAALAMVLSLRISLPAHAQDSLPGVAKRGLDALAVGRPDSALVIWAGSAAFGAEERQQILSSVPVFVETCGNALGYDTLRTIRLGLYLRRVYFIARCSVRPIYVMFVVYRASDDWTITALNWNTDPDRVLPAFLFGAQRP